MYLDHAHQGKIDPLLQDALERAESEDVLRVVMVLGAEQEENGVALSTQPLDPEQFAMRQDYRQALITQRQQSLSESLSTTLESLRNLSLKTYGGMTSRLVVAEGTAQQLARALTLEGVRSVSLDQVIRVGEAPPPDEAIEAFLKLFAEVLPDLHTNQPLKQTVAEAISFYIQTYQQLHGRLKVLGMQEPVLLESIYTSVQFLEKADLWRFGSLEDIEKAFRGAQNRGFQPEDCRKQDGLAVANTQPLLMVLGGPGSGKSTFLRRIGLEALKGNSAQYQHSLFPIFIELKRFTAEVNLTEVIVEQLRECNFPRADVLAKALLEQGKLLILLDGLDEVPTQQLDRVTRTIQEFIKRYNTNRFIGSCRTAAYRSYFKQFAEVFMADFGPEQIRQFIQNWFQSPEDLRFDTAQSFWTLLEQPDYKAVRELAQTPLLLTLLCLVFDDAQDLPKNRAVLYDEALDVLLKRWAAEKRIQRDPIYREFSIGLEEQMLAQLAYQTFAADRLFFPRQEAVENIHTFLIGNLNAPKNLDALAILNAIEVQQGILVERAKDVLSFSHLTIQEFLTAQYIIDNGMIEEQVQEHLTDSRWREVFLLTAGLSNSADFLLKEMLQKAQSFITTPRLKSLFSWAERETSSSAHSNQSTAKRTLALTLSLTLALDFYRVRDLTFILDDHPLVFEHTRTLPFALNCALNLGHTLVSKRDMNLHLVEEHSLDLFCILKKNKIFTSVNFSELEAQRESLGREMPRMDHPVSSRRKFIENSKFIWYQALHLDPEWVNLSRDEIVALTHYLEVCNLMVRCKESAVSISPSVWTDIVDSLVRTEPLEPNSRIVQQNFILSRLNPFRGSSQSEKV